MASDSEALNAWFENAYAISSVWAYGSPKKRNPNMPKPTIDNKLLVIGRNIFSLSPNSTYADIQGSLKACQQYHLQSSSFAYVYISRIHIHQKHVYLPLIILIHTTHTPASRMQTLLPRPGGVPHQGERAPERARMH